MAAGVKVIKKPARTIAQQSYLVELAKGLGVTFKHFFRSWGQMLSGNRPDPREFNYEEGINTMEYPDVKKPYAERYSLEPPYPKLFSIRIV